MCVWGEVRPEERSSEEAGQGLQCQCGVTEGADSGECRESGRWRIAPNTGTLTAGGTPVSINSVAAGDGAGSDCRAAVPCDPSGRDPDL